MKIHLSDELADLITQDLQHGLYENADAFVERAILDLHEQERWLAEHKGAIEASIEMGFRAAKAGNVMLIMR